MVSFLVDVATVSAIFGIVGMTLHLQAGLTGLLNFGVVAFFGIGAYASAISEMRGIAWPIGMLLGVIIASIAGGLVGLLGRTLAAEYWAIGTLALAELLRLVALNSDGWTRGARGISGVPPFFAGLTSAQRSLAWLALSALVLAFCGLVAWTLARGQYGRVIRLIREQENLAASLGHNVVKTKVSLMSVSAPMASVAGSLFAHYTSFVGPQELAPSVTFVVWTMAVVGGLASPLGIVIGAVLVQMIYDLTRFVDDVFAVPSDTAGGLRILIVGAALLGFLLFRPAGLIPERPRTFNDRS